MDEHPTVDGVAPAQPKPPADELNTAAVRTYAALAAKWTIEHPPWPNRIVTRQRVLRAGNFPKQPTNLSDKRRRRWDLARVEFFEHWRWLVLNAIGRWPTTVVGRGFDLLSVDDSVQFLACAAYDDAARALAKGGARLGSIKPVHVSPSMRPQQADEMVRIGRQRMMMRQEHERAVQTFATKGDDDDK